MNIGDASRASRVSTKMIRYYEQIGLIPPADRTLSGYRAYTAADVQRLSFIRRARDLGFPVAEIGDLLGLWNDGARHSADVKRLAEMHIADMKQRMENLRQMSEALQALISCCVGDTRPDCPILASLAQHDARVDGPLSRTGAMARRTRAATAAG